MPDQSDGERNLLLDQAAISFNYLIGDTSKQTTPNEGSSSQPRRYTSEEPQLYIKVKEENENLKARVDQLELELNEKTKQVNSLDRRNDRLHNKLENKDKSIQKLRDNLKQLKDDI